MALSDIKKVILEKAEEIAEEHREVGKKRAEMIVDGWKKRASERREELLRGAKRDAEKKVLQAEFELQSEAQLHLLGKKKEIIERVYKVALKELSSIDGDEYIQLMKKLITCLPKEKGVFISAKGREDLLKKALQERGDELSSSVVDSKGGFIFQSEKVDIDQTFESLIENNKEETLLIVSHKIFEKNE